jgi:hypothetical protein
MVKRGNSYGPEPRKMSSYKPEFDLVGLDEFVLLS